MSTRLVFWATLLAAAAFFSCCAVEAGATANFSDVAHPFVKRSWGNVLTTAFKNTMAQGADDVRYVLSMAKGVMALGTKKVDPVQKAKLAFEQERVKLRETWKALAGPKSGSHLKPLKENLARALDDFNAFDPTRPGKADLLKLRARVIAADAALKRARNPPELVAALKKQVVKVDKAELRFLRADYDAKLVSEIDKVRVVRNEFRKKKILLETLNKEEEKLRVFMQTDTQQLARIRELESKVDPVLSRLKARQA